MDKLLLGKPVADNITNMVISEVKNLKAKNIFPKLFIVRVGENGDDIAYERSAMRRMNLCGIEVENKVFEEDVKEDELIGFLDRLNNDQSINGILLFSSLPKHLDERRIKEAIHHTKDVDCFNSENIGKILLEDKSGFLPCTPMAAMEIIDFYGIELKGKSVAVVGRSLIVGKPMALLLLERNATVKICHSDTVNLDQITKISDVIVSSVGSSHLINSQHVKDGAYVIDIGINVDEEGNITGDVDTESVLDKVSGITPVPRGVGSVTTAVLAKNVLKATQLQNGDEIKWCVIK